MQNTNIKIWAPHLAIFRSPWLQQKSHRITDFLGRYLQKSWWDYSRFVVEEVLTFHYEIFVVLLTLPRLFQSSSSLRRSVRLRWMIRCRRLSKQNDFMCCEENLKVNKRNQYLKMYITTKRILQEKEQSRRNRQKTCLILEMQTSYVLNKGNSHKIHELRVLTACA